MLTILIRRDYFETKETKQPDSHLGLCGRAQKPDDPGLYPVRPVGGTGAGAVSLCLAGGQKHTGRLAQPARGRGSGSFWLDGGVVCHWQYPAVLCRPYVHPYRRLPHRPEHPARRYDPCAEASPGLFYRESIGAAAQAHRRQRRAHRGPACPQAPRPGRHGGDTHRCHRRAVPL